MIGPASALPDLLALSALCLSAWTCQRFATTLFFSALPEALTERFAWALVPASALLQCFTTALCLRILPEPLALPALATVLYYSALPGTLPPAWLYQHLLQLFTTALCLSVLTERFPWALGPVSTLLQLLWISPAIKALVRNPTSQAGVEITCVPLRRLVQSLAYMFSCKWTCELSGSKTRVWCLYRYLVHGRKDPCFQKPIICAPIIPKPQFHLPQKMIYFSTLWLEGL